jgi:hypothetical protein
MLLLLMMMIMAFSMKKGPAGRNKVMSMEMALMKDGSGRS